MFVSFRLINSSEMIFFLLEKILLIFVGYRGKFILIRFSRFMNDIITLM